MLWKKQGRFEIGENKVEIRSIKLKDERGKVKRLRVCSVYGDFSEFTKIPAIGHLFKDEKGYIGIYISGKSGAYIKIGKNFLISQNLIVPLNSIAKINLKKLLKGYNIELFENEDIIYGIEK
ncbi:MAG: hypothetical protein NC827_01795 [Candidatus Omnitrophica bacterium]|nr:hypothetical protein [Candidatus Omnitrophota bacterium]MCM8802028.1 hypothetical protein [Candidatus Omnitrophota bacterium]